MKSSDKVDLVSYDTLPFAFDGKHKFSSYTGGFVNKIVDQYSDTDKAFWILENNWSQKSIIWVYERVDERLYKRPIAGQLLPPWWPKDYRGYIGNYPSLLKEINSRLTKT